MVTVDARVPRPGDPVDLARWADWRWWTGAERNDLHTHALARNAEGVLLAERDPAGGGWQIGLEWAEARDVCRVVARFPSAEEVPSDLRVQYWRKNWPTPAPERRPGAARGWIGCDDPFHGQWTTARGAVQRTGDTWSIVFDPLDVIELGGRDAVQQLDLAEDYRARFRRTLKLRLGSADAQRPRLVDLQAFSPSLWQEETLQVRFGVARNEHADLSGSAEVHNGLLLGVEGLDLAAGDGVSADGSWLLERPAPGRGVALRVLHTGDPLGVGDRTVVTVYTPPHSFSFALADLQRGPIYIAPYDVYITTASSPVPWEAHQQALAARPASLYARVEAEPEGSWERALEEIPPLDVTKQAPYGLYLPLAVDAGRQEWALRYNGELFGDKWFMKILGRDAARLEWPSHVIRYRFGSGDPVDFRERCDATRQSLLDGWLPVVTSTWLDREIAYSQTSFATLLDGPLTPPAERRGDEDTVVMMRFHIRNTTHYTKRARLWIVMSPQERVVLREGLMLAEGRVVPAEPVKRQWRVDAYHEPVLRCAILADPRCALSETTYAESPDESRAIPTGVAYDVDLQGGESAALTLAIPFASLSTTEEWRRVTALDFETTLSDVERYWRDYVESGGSLELPHRELSDLHKAARTHIAVSVDKDPVTGLTIVPAGTWRYGACGNEACWQITMLDQAGHHERAEEYLETFLRLQGAKGLDGNFGSAEGALLGLDLDDGVPLTTVFSYNLDHGYIMECLADHYRYTRNRAWLDRVAPKLVAACDLVTRERAATLVFDDRGQASESWGLMPAGHLEDNPEWRHWFAVNAHAYNGMRGVAEVLGEIEHPDAQRLASDAEAFRMDIRAAARRAMIESPVVQLLDGSYLPHIPTRTGIRGRERGWFRETAYGAVHLLEANVFDPDEEEMTWVLQDLEDNLFVTLEWGRPVDLGNFWFSHGGVTIQSNLMDTAIDYLRRGQTKHALRALWNNIASHLYPATRCFTECPVEELGHGLGPFFKTPDESKALIWLRTMLLREEGQTLHLAEGAPRAWFAAGESFGVREMASYWGRVSYHVTSDQNGCRFDVQLDPDRAPREVTLHVRPIVGHRIADATWEGAACAVDAEREIVRVAAPTASFSVQVRHALE
ncbi:MAG: hypothetical protein ACYC5M_14435 [Anaerolineae bacterium]